MITLFYTALICLLGYIFSDQSKDSRLRYAIGAGLILTLISGLRHIMVGTDDTYIYSMQFLDVQNTSFDMLLKSDEKDPYYQVFSKIVGMLVGNNFNLVLLVYAVIFVVPVSIMIYKESPKMFLSYIILLSMGFFSFSMNGIRQGLAMSFVILSFPYLRDRKLWKFIACVIIASLFHKTALIFLGAYWLAFIPLNKKTIFFYLIIFAACLLYGDQIARFIATESSVYDTRFEGYITRTNGLTYSGLIQFLLFFVLCFAYYKPTVKYDKTSICWFNMLILAIIFQTMAVVIAEFFRVAMYFSVFLIILVPKVLESVPINNRKIYTGILSVLLLIYFFYLGAGTIEYKFFWQ